MFSFSVLRAGATNLPASIGVIVGIATVFLASGEAKAEHYRSYCGGTYEAVYYQPRYYSPPVVYVKEPVVYVERIRPPVYVRYHSHPRPYGYYYAGNVLGHVVHHLFHGGHRHHHSSHGYGYGYGYGYGHHHGHRGHHGHGHYHR